MGKWPTDAWGQHGAVTTSKWTSLFPGNVLPLENAWPHWQVPYQWHSWSPPLTATTHCQSSTPKPPGRGLVSIIPQRSSLMCLKKAAGGKATQAGTAACSTVAGSRGLGGAGRSELAPCGTSPSCWKSGHRQVLC